MTGKLKLMLRVRCGFLPGAQSGLLTRNRGDGQRFVVHADDKFTAFLGLERAVWLRLLRTERIAGQSLRFQNAE